MQINCQNLIWQQVFIDILNVYYSFEFNDKCFSYFRADPSHIEFFIWFLDEFERKMLENYFINRHPPSLSFFWLLTEHVEGE